MELLMKLASCSVVNPIVLLRIWNFKRTNHIKTCFFRLCCHESVTYTIKCVLGKVKFIRLYHALWLKIIHLLI